jgi:hypothetical protein
MIPNPVSYLRSLIFLFAFSACSTGRIYISILQPAEVSIPLDIQKVSLFPGGGFPSPNGKFDSIEHAKLRPDFNYNPIKRGYMEGVYEVISQSPRFTKVVLSDTSYEHLMTGGVISWDQLQEICNHDSTDAILLLKKAVTHDILDYVYEEENCGLRYNLVNNTKWCFYQPSTMIASNDFIFTDFINYEQPFENCQPVPLKNINGILYDACMNTGIRLGEQICPGWRDNIERIVFSGPGKSLKEAYFLATHNQWHQAAVIWNDLSAGQNRNQACRASFNLALTWERDDDLEQAREWAIYADSLHSNKKTKAYIKILDQRIRFKSELENQMEGK